MSTDQETSLRKPASTNRLATITLILGVVSVMAYFCLGLYPLAREREIFQPGILTSLLVSFEIIASLGLVSIILGLIAFIRELRKPKENQKNSVIYYSVAGLTLGIPGVKVLIQMIIALLG